MKKILPILAALILMLSAFRDPVAPDMEAIHREVTNPESKYYYPRLMSEYERNETIMTAEDYRYLYFGYIFEEDFHPYRTSPNSHIVEVLYYKSQHTKSECDSIIKLAEQSLKDNPFDLQQMDYLIYALREKKKNNLANIWQFRLNHLLEAIVSSGTGLDMENAWYVVSPQHEYFLLNRLGHTAQHYEYIAPGIDHITVAPKSAKDSTDYYFNSSYFVQEYNRKFWTEDDDEDQSFND